MRTHFIFFLFLFSVELLSFNVNDSLLTITQFPFRVDSIKIVGNEITKENVILNEIDFRIGESLDSARLFFNRERIFSLKIFTDVNLLQEKNDTLNILVINVKESWYIWLIPQLFFADRDYSKISYGLRLDLNNFRGMNEEIKLIFTLGFDPSLRISYRVPYLFKSENIFSDFLLETVNAENRSLIAEEIYGEDFKQKIYSFRFNLGKRFDLFNRLALTSGFNYIETPKYFPKINASEDRIDRVFYLGLRYTYDTRDLIQFPTNGEIFISDLTNKGFGFDNINYQIFFFDYRKYFPLSSDLSAKFRVMTRQAIGDDVPFYDQSFIGLNERIRGHFSLQQEGNSSYFSSVEINFPIIKEYFFSMELPVIPKSLTSFRTAIYAHSFFDVGLSRMRNIPINFSNLNSGFGIGLTILTLPYNIARIEYAINNLGIKEIILDLGISF